MWLTAIWSEPDAEVTAIISESLVIARKRLHNFCPKRKNKFSFFNWLRTSCLPLLSSNVSLYWKQLQGWWLGRNMRLSDDRESRAGRNQKSFWKYNLGKVERIQAQKEPQLSTKLHIRIRRRCWKLKILVPLCQLTCSDSKIVYIVLPVGSLNLRHGHVNSARNSVENIKSNVLFLWIAAGMKKGGQIALPWTSCRLERTRFRDRALSACRFWLALLCNFNKQSTGAVVWCISGNRSSQGIVSSLTVVQGAVLIHTSFKYRST